MLLPNFVDYWNPDSIFNQLDIVKGMSQNRFEQLCGRLHFNDNSLVPAHGTPRYDRLYKIRPVLDSICEKSLRLYNPGKKLTVDEAMVKFKGRSSIKQYQPLKPIKRGFKVWCRADSDNGYISNFAVYTGKVDGSTKDLGYKVVMTLCKDIFDKGYEVYFDNYFSSVHLAVDLLKHGTSSVATTQPNRVGFPKNDINRNSVGCSRGMTNSTILDDKVHCFVWLDNKPVFFIDTLCGCALLTTVTRDLSDVTTLRVSCQPVVKAYNVWMHFTYYSN